MKTLADRIRVYGRENYALPARKKKERRFSIKAGDVVHALKINGYTPAVCSALKTGKFLKENNLRLVDSSGPSSGQSTTVVYTYEFIDGFEGDSTASSEMSSVNDAWNRLRGAMKDIFAEYGGGEAYLRAERENFYGNKESK